MHSIERQEGFTIVEVVIAIAIIAIISTIVGVSFLRAVNDQNLKRSAATVRAVLEDARARTLASRDAAQYGVHFATTTITLFKGDTYVENDPLNEDVLLAPHTEITTLSLSSGSDVVFERLTGAALTTGTVVVAMTSEFATTTQSITINASGLIEAQ